MATPVFDPLKYKSMTREQWQSAAEPWHRWRPMLADWLGPATEMMLAMAGIGPGSRVLDVAAGAGDQTLMAARQVGPSGYVLATDLSPNILEFAAAEANAAGLANVATRVMDGENLDELEENSFDAVISRVGLIYFPDQHKALQGMRRVLKPGGKIAAIVYSPADRNQFFSIPIGIVRRRAALPPPLPGQPGPFSLGQPGVLEAAFQKAGFADIQTRIVAAPVRPASASELVRFARESWGALHQMMAGLSQAEQEAAWAEMEQQLKQFESAAGFAAPCELVIGVGTKLE
jgi:SAM-dependent methyltransferase